MKYVLGVDGGNTKTDYILFDEFGNFVDGHRSGTCSHEALKDSFSGTYRVMKEEVEKLLSRNNMLHTIRELKEITLEEINKRITKVNP